MKRKVSIIVPLYKSEKYIEKLIESILKQSYKNIELILVDDGSPDNSGKICDKYVALDERVKVIHKKNGGTCEARNYGLKEVTGEYLTFADGDDWLELDYLEYLVNILESNNCEMSMTDAIFTTRDRKQNNNDKIEVVDSEEATCRILYDKVPVGPWNKLYLTELIRRNNISFSVLWFGEGLYFSVMSAQYSKKIAIGHRKIYNFRLYNPNSGTTVMKIDNGINSLKNIIFIKNNLIVNTKRTNISADWHIWQNNYNLMLYIVFNGMPSKYKFDYKKCRINLLKLTPSVVLKSEISFKEKIKIFIKTLFPRLTILSSISKQKNLLLKDNFNI